MVFLGLLAGLVIFLFRRRRRHQHQSTDNNDNDDKGRRRWTFHREKMILPPVLDIRRISPLDPQYSSEEEDIERQGGGRGGLLHDDNIPTFPIVPIVTTTTSSPSGGGGGGFRKSLLKPFRRPLPVPPPPPIVPLKPHQQEMVDQMEHIRNKVVELKKKEENSGPTEHIILDDLQKQMIWLESQMKKENIRS